MATMVENQPDYATAFLLFCEPRVEDAPELLHRHVERVQDGGDALERGTAASALKLGDEVS